MSVGYGTSARCNRINASVFDCRAARESISSLAAVLGLLACTTAGAAASGAAAAKSGEGLRGTVYPNSYKMALAKVPRIVSGSTAAPKTEVPNLPRLKFATYRFQAPTPPAAKLKLASLGPQTQPKLVPKREPRLQHHSGGLVKWLAYPGCVPRALRGVLSELAEKFGDVTVNSTHRDRHHNRQVGGASHSYHLKCQAVDFKLKRNFRAAHAFLKRQSEVGGLKHYGAGVFHIDIGPRRTW